MIDDTDLLSPEHPTFDEDGRPCLYTDPAVYDDDQEPAAEERALDLAEFLDAALAGSVSLAVIGERILLTAFILRIPLAPTNYRDLGAVLGLSHTGARKRVSKFKADFCKELGKVVSKLPIGDK
jgi:hypothetical protein